MTRPSAASAGGTRVVFPRLAPPSDESAVVAHLAHDLRQVGIDGKDVHSLNATALIATVERSHGSHESHGSGPCCFRAIRVIRGAIRDKRSVEEGLF